MAGTRNPPRTRRRVDVTWSAPQLQEKDGESGPASVFFDVRNVSEGQKTVQIGDAPRKLSCVCCPDFGGSEGQGVPQLQEKDGGSAPGYVLGGSVGGCGGLGGSEGQGGPLSQQNDGESALATMFSNVQNVPGSKGQGSARMEPGNLGKSLQFGDAPGEPPCVCCDLSGGSEGQGQGAEKEADHLTPALQLGCGLSGEPACGDAILECVRSPEIDVHTFAKQVVGQARDALFRAAGVSGGPAELRDLVKVVLKPTDGLAGSVAEKLRLAELQICFRMEMISAFATEWGEEHTRLLDQVCEVLDSVQFVLENESMLEYVDRVVRSRYGAIVPEAVERIYSQAELQGYNDQSASSGSPATGVDEARISEDYEIPISAWHSQPTLALSLERSIHAMGSALKNRSIRKEIFKASTAIEDDLRHNECLQKRARATRLSHFGNTRLMQKLVTVLPTKNRQSVLERRKTRRYSAVDKAVPKSVVDKSHHTVLETPVRAKSKNPVLSSSTPSALVLETPVRIKPRNSVLTPSTSSALRRPGPSPSRPLMMVTPNTAAKGFHPVLATPRRAGPSRSSMMVTPKTAARDDFQPVLATPRRAGASRPLVMVTPKSAARTFQPVLATPRRAGTRSVHFSSVMLEESASAAVPASKVCPATIPGLPKDAERAAPESDEGINVPVVEETGGGEAQDLHVAKIACTTNNRSESFPAKELGEQQPTTNPPAGQEARADSEVETQCEVPVTLQQDRLKKLARKRPFRFLKPSRPDEILGSRAPRRTRIRSVA